MKQSKWWKKRWVRVFTCILCFFLCIAVALWVTEQSQLTTSSVKNTEDANMHLSVLFPYDTQKEQEYLQSIADSFMDKHPDILLEVDYYPREDAWQALYNYHTNQNLSELVLMENTTVSAFQSLDIIKPMDYFYQNTALDKNFYSKLLDSVTIDGKYYAVPFTAHTYALYCNMDLLSKYDCALPQTLDEVMYTAMELKREPADSIAMAAVRGEALSHQFVQLLYGNGASIRNLKDENAVEIILMLDNLVKQRLIARDCVNWNARDLTEKFASREVAMMIGDSAQLVQLSEANVDFNWMVTRLPVEELGKNLYTGESFVSTTDTLSLAAQTFLSFVSESQEVLTRAEMMGSIPVRIDTDSPVFERNSMNSIFLANFYEADALPNFVLWQKMSKTLQNVVIDIFRQEKSPQEIALEAHALMIDHILEGR